MTHINIGIDREHRLNTAEGLKRLLADSYTLYLKRIIFIGMWKVRISENCI